MSQVEQELLILPEHLSSPPVFSGVNVTRSFVFCVVFCRLCLSSFFWSLYCLSFYDLQLLITLLIYSNFSYLWCIAKLKEKGLTLYFHNNLLIRPFRDEPYYVIGYGGGRAGVHTGFCTITLVLYIRSLPNLAIWFPCGRGRTLFILGSLGQRSRSPLL